MPLLSFFIKKCGKKIGKLSTTYEKVQTTSISTVSDYPVPDLTPIVIKNKLNSARIKYTTGYTSFILPECNMCVPLKKPSTNRINSSYINKQTGFYVCELCKCSGPWEVFEKLLTKNNDNNKSGKDVTGLRDGLNSYCEREHISWKNMALENVAVSSLAEQEYSDVFQTFNLPTISRLVCEKLNVHISYNKRTLYIPILLNQQVMGFICYDVEKGQTVVPKRNCAGFLLFTPKRKQSTAIVVSNLKDFFALADSNVTNNIICLPYGVSNIPQILLPFLEQYESLTLWLGTVNGAWDATRNFAKKLNEKRCFMILAHEKQASPSIALENNQNIRKILSEAQPTWHQFITTFASLRKDVLLELQNFEQVLGVKWKRFPVLNKTLKGLRRGELTVLTGPTGAGKTTLMAEYSLDLATQGVNTLWGSFEVRNVRLARTMLQQFVGRPLEERMVEFDEWADKFEQLPLYYLTFHGQQSIKNVMEAVQHAAYIHDIAHVIIDNVQFMIGMNEDSKYHDRFHKQDLIIHAFRTFASRCNVHVTLVIHPRKEKESDDLTASSIFGGAKAAQEADNVLIIQDKRLTNVKGKKFLQVAKNRYTGDLGIMPLEFDKDSLSFRPKKKPLSTESQNIASHPEPIT